MTHSRPVCSGAAVLLLALALLPLDALAQSNQGNVQGTVVVMQRDFKVGRAQDRTAAS